MNRGLFEQWLITIETFDDMKLFYSAVLGKSFLSYFMFIIFNCSLHKAAVKDDASFQGF